VTQRGVRRMDVFFCDEDRRRYLRELAEQSRRFGVRYLAWCLMSNHVHLIAVPETQTSLAKGIGEAHKRYTRRVNRRQGWRGYLFQGRFFSCPLDGDDTMAAVRYVLRNPVRAGIAATAWAYPWSSARWLVGESPVDALVRDASLRFEVDDWRELLAVEAQDPDSLRRHTRTGRPLGDGSFVARVEMVTGRSLRRRKPGRKPAK